MLYLNQTNNLYYTDAEFTSLANGWDSNDGIYYINGVQTNLDESGNGTYDEDYYVNGSLANGVYGNHYYVNGNYATGTIDGVYYVNGPRYTGWDSSSSTYYINGLSTSLDSTGSGWEPNTYNSNTGTNGMYFVNGVGLNRLNSSGTGSRNHPGHAGFEAWYINGVLTTLGDGGNGVWNDAYYLNSTVTTLDNTGSGTYNNLLYSNGVLLNGVYNNFIYFNGALQTPLRSGNGALFTGTFEGNYYVNGEPGNGSYNGVYYSNGNPATGTFGGLYYSNGTPFTGTFENIEYVNGSKVYYFNNVSSHNFADINNWFYDEALTIPAGETGRGGHIKISSSCTSTELYFDGSEIKSIDVSACNTIQRLRINDNQLTSLNVSNLSNLYLLYCHNNNLTSLDVSGLSVLSSLYCMFNELTSLNVAGCTSLQEFRLQNNNLNQEQIDQLLADLDDNGASPGYLIYFGGNNASPSEVGLLSETNLIARNWSIFIPSSGGGSGSGSGSGSGDVGVGLGNIGQFLNGKYYIQGVATTLDQNGNGWWRGKKYSSGSLLTAGPFDNGINLYGWGNNFEIGVNIAKEYQSLFSIKFAEVTTSGVINTLTSLAEKVELVPSYNENNLIVSWKFINSNNVSYSGPIELTFYIPENFSQAVFNRCKIYHVKTDNTVEELSRVSSNFATRAIVVQVDSFSDFVIMDNPPPPPNQLLVSGGQNLTVNTTSINGEEANGVYTKESNLNGFATWRKGNLVIRIETFGGSPMRQWLIVNETNNQTLFSNNGSFAVADTPTSPSGLSFSYSMNGPGSNLSITEYIESSSTPKIVNIQGNAKFFGNVKFVV